jgi:hypothetical protein
MATETSDVSTRGHKETIDASATTYQGDNPCQRGGKMTVHIKLYGEKGERFEEIKRDLTEHLGYEPSNPEVVGFLMGDFDQPELNLTSAEKK